MKYPEGIDPLKGTPPFIYCFWHSRLLTVAYFFRNTGKTAVVSSSRDGRLAAKIAKGWKHGVIFGSSSRGGSTAVRKCLKVLKNGSAIGITPDGPKGPVEKAKPGAARISIKSGVPIVIINVFADRAWHLNSWDSLMIPKLFARVSITLSDPIDPQGFVHEDNREESLTREIQNRFRS